MITIDDVEANASTYKEVLTLSRNLRDHHIAICPYYVNFSKDPKDKDLKGKRLLIARDDFKPIGYLLYQLDNAITIVELFVDRHYRSKGIGKQLIDTLKDKLVKTIKIIRVGTLDNPSAIKFYQSLGFEIVDCTDYIDIRRTKIKGITLNTYHESGTPRNQYSVFLGSTKLGFIKYHLDKDKSKIFSINELILDKLSFEVDIVTPIKYHHPNTEIIFCHYYPDAKEYIEENLRKLQFKTFGYELSYVY